MTRNQLNRERINRFRALRLKKRKIFSFDMYLSNMDATSSPLVPVLDRDTFKNCLLERQEMEYMQ